MTTIKRCSTCGTISGTCICTGCQSLFCPQHFNDHRYSMTMQMNHLINDCNQLMTKTKGTNQIQRVESSLLARIDNWQKGMMEKVIQIAENTRQQALQLIYRKKSEIIEGIELIGKEIRLRKDVNDFIEHDIERLNIMINNLQQDLNHFIQQPIELYINNNPQIDWNKLIYVEYNSPLLSEQNRSFITKDKVVSPMRKRSCLRATGCDDCIYVANSGGWNDGGYYRRSDTGGYCHCTCHQNEKKNKQIL
ncbi:hypothetical protein I4U23_011453 [Adineta vaga]|nr:hypothetical protein I4U23_011453 [Adineta vaga]